MKALAAKPVVAMIPPERIAVLQLNLLINIPHIGAERKCLQNTYISGVL